jgi:hypothetical protein
MEPPMIIPFPTVRSEGLSEADIVEAAATIWRQGGRAERGAAENGALSVAIYRPGAEWASAALGRERGHYVLLDSEGRTVAADVALARVLAAVPDLRAAI